MTALAVTANHSMRKTGKTVPATGQQQQITCYEKFLLAGFGLLIAFNFISILLIVYETHWYGPVQDFWGSIPFIEKALTTGEWHSDDLWIAQNNHRLVLPRLAFLVDYRYFDGSNHFLTGLGITLIIVEIAALLYLIRLTSIQASQRLLIIMLGIAIICMPIVAYNLIHTFNSQWIQCSTLALLTSALAAYGLERRSMAIFIAGLAAALLCHFTTFTLTAIWPSLLYLLLVYRAQSAYWLITLLTAVVFGYCFLFILPTEDIPGGRYDVIPSLESLSFSQLGHYFVAIAVYVSSYLSMPLAFVGDTFAQLLAALSIVWVGFNIVRHPIDTSNHVHKTLTAVLVFCLCLAITTAIGRAYMGDVGSGPRFGPIVLLYWAALTLHLMLRISQRFDRRWSNHALAMLLGILLATSTSQTTAIGKRLAEDHNRFVVPQMAHLIGDLRKNAVYENLVVAWRETSYPGIVSAIPYLRDNRKGIFSSKLAHHVNTHIDGGTHESCGTATITQKARSNDPLIRQIHITNSIDFVPSHNRYLAIYDQSQLVALLFEKRNHPLKQLFQRQARSWIGISSIPIDLSTMTLIGWGEDGDACQLKMVEHGDKAN